MLSRIIAVLLIFLGTLVACPTSSFAQDDENASQFSFSPVESKDPAVTEKGYFVYSVKPGGSTTGSVLLQNTSKRPVIIELAVLDAETAQTGGSSFSATGATPKAVGRWVELAEPRVTLQPDKQQEVQFSVRVPQSVKPGQYLAGITAYVSSKPSEAAKRNEGQAGASVNVQTRYVIAVQVNVPGKQVPSLTISSVSLLEQPTGRSIGIAMKNDGGLLLKPSGSLTLTNSGGKEVLEEKIKMDTFVTGTETTYPVAVPQAVPPGKYNVEVKLSYAQGKAANYKGGIEIKAPAGASQPAPQTGAEEGAQQDAGTVGATSQPGQQASPVTSGIQPWMIYAVGGLLLLVVVLLALNLMRGRAGKGTT